MLVNNEEYKFDKNLLSHYAKSFKSIAGYDGENGVLKLKDGRNLKCKFVVGQLSNGDVILLCEFCKNSTPDFSTIIQANIFEGTSSEGYEIRGEVNIEKYYLPEVQKDRSGVWAAFILDKLSVKISNNKPYTVHFGITNFKFCGTTPEKLSSQYSHLIIPLNLKYKEKENELIIRPICNYKKKIEILSTLKGIDVTCEAIIEITKEEDIHKLEEVVEDLCYLLSIARGSKINWIYCDKYDNNGGYVERTHHSRITKSFVPLHIIDSGINGREETKEFIEKSYPVYMEKRDSYKLKDRTIDAYLDAKSETDYLQMRGIKLAVTMEILKYVFSELSNSPVEEYIINEEDFDEHIKNIKNSINSYLKENKINSVYRNAICSDGKIKGLNRRSFSYIIKRLCKEINLQVDSVDIKKFVVFRNKLIHTGDFYYNVANPSEKEKLKPLPSASHEYSFIINFLDKIFLKLLGYSGMYIDWSIPGNRLPKKLG
jgi:hypothetical protein